MKNLLVFCFASLVMLLFSPIVGLAKDPPAKTYSEIVFSPCIPFIDYTPIEATVTETLELQYSSFAVSSVEFSSPIFAWLVEDPGQILSNSNSLPFERTKSNLNSTKSLALEHPRIREFRNLQAPWKSLNHNIRLSRRT